MGMAIGTVIVGIFISILGFFNMKGKISSLRRYYRRRIPEENRLPFLRLIGLRTIICGVSLVVFGCLSYAAMKTQIEHFTIIGTMIFVIGLVVELALSLYAIIKYNKGIF